MRALSLSDLLHSEYTGPLSTRDVVFNDRINISVIRCTLPISSPSQYGNHIVLCPSEIVRAGTGELALRLRTIANVGFREQQPPVYIGVD